MNLLIIVILALIFVSLAAALIFLFKDKGNSRRSLNALRVRVGLSALLIAGLLFGKFAGFLETSSVINQQPPVELKQP